MPAPTCKAIFISEANQPHSFSLIFNNFCALGGASKQKPPAIYWRSTGSSNPNHSFMQLYRKDYMKYTALPRLGSLSKKSCCALITCGLALSLAPAAAFAHYEYNNDSKVIFGKDGTTSDGLDIGSVEKLSSKTNSDGTSSVTYRGYANSDKGAHFLGYSVYTKITYDKSGTMTAIDMSSANDTFAGTWGYMRSGHNKVYINGYLPKGVNFNAEKKSDGIYAVSLTGANSAGYSVNAVTLMSVSDNAVNQDSDGTDMSYEVATSSANWDEKGTITLGDYQDINLVRVRYQIGTESGLYFDTYFTIGEDGSVDGSDAANNYIDNCIADTSYDDDASYTGNMASTNRDKWAYATASMISQRTLQAYASSLKGGSDATSDLDTVTGATLVSTPYVEAIMSSVNDGYVKTIADNVKITIDGEKDSTNNSSIDVSSNPLDDTTVTKNDDGTYTIKHYYKLQDRSGASVPTDFSIYALGGSTTSAENHDIVKNKSDKTELVKYDPTSLKLNPQTSTNKKGETTTSYSWADFETDYVSFKSRDSEGYYTITTKNPSITHVSIGYTIGHTSGCKTIYDLEQMVKASEVNESIASMDASDEAAVAAQRSAYDALCSDVKGFVTNIDTLVNAEKAIASKVVSLSNAKISISSSCTYNGKAQQPSVSVSLDGKTLSQGTDYTVGYANNTNAGAASVTVTGIGKYEGTASGKFTIAKANQSLTAKASTKTVKKAKVKKKAQKVSGAIKVSGAQGKVTYAKKSGSNKLSVASSGKITVKKKTKKGTYKVKVVVKAAGNGNYNAATKTATVKVKVK